MEPTAVREVRESVVEPFGSYAPTAAQRLVLATVRRSTLKRGAFRPAVSRLLDALRHGPIDAAFQGASFRFHHQDSATERGALLNPSYDAVEIDFLRASLQPGGTVVDIGANVGIYALPLARLVGQGGRVVAIEPHPIAQQRLAFNAAASELSNVRRVHAAVGAADGIVSIETDPDNLGASRAGAATTEPARLQVECRTLRGVLSDAGLASVDAMKIDVEGGEDRVLIGFFREAPPSLWPGAVVIEHLSAREWSEDCIAAMTSRGYVVEATTRSNTLLKRPTSEARA